MARVCVSEAAKRLGVGVPRIHQRIADGSLHAERIGSQWVVDELSLLRLAERRSPGRPLSARSAWALIALTERDDRALAALSPSERRRARDRLSDLLSLVAKAPRTEDGVRLVASALRSLFRNRAERQSYKAAIGDLAGVREDPRWESVLSSGVSGIASPDVDGYLSPEYVDSLVRDYLLTLGDAGANVVLHVLPAGQKAYPTSKLMLAADLAEYRGPREELWATELLSEVAEDQASLSR